MPVFAYVATDSYGRRSQSYITARTPEEAATQLRRSQLTPLSVKKDWLRSTIPTRQTVTVNQLSLFTRMYGAMLEAGMAMDQILRTLAEQSVAKPLKVALQRVIIDVESGILISDSLRKHARIFSPLYCSMIAAGETSGSLDRLLGRLAEMLDRTDIVRSKINE